MFDTSQPGPFYEDFVSGAELPALPSVTFTDADNVLYRSITGDQHRFSSDVALYRAAGGTGAIVNPGIVMQYSIGQSTMATRQAVANLYYRSIRVLAPVEVGETLSTVTKVLGLSDAKPKGDQYRGKVWLGITSSTENGPVAKYERCALVRARGSEQPGHADDIPLPGDPAVLDDLVGAVPSWDLSVLPTTPWSAGETRTDPLRDHVDLAASLARVTFNQAAVHRDRTLTATGSHLVYGGHVQGLAQASLTRMLPGLAAVLAWDGCDHLAPAAELDLLEFHHTLVEEQPAGTGRLLRFEVIGTRIDDEGGTDLLRWTPTVWAP